MESAEELGHHLIAAEAPENQREQGSANQDREDHRGHANGRSHDVTEDFKGELPSMKREQHRTDRTDAGRFGRRG